MQTSGRYVEYHGERYPVLFAGPDWLAVPAAAQDRESGRFPDALEYGHNSRGAWAKLPKDALDRRLDVRVGARWRGEPVTVSADLGHEVVLDWAGTAERARELGLDGDQYHGWQLRVPVDEVEVADVEEREY